MLSIGWIWLGKIICCDVSLVIKYRNMTSKSGEYKTQTKYAFSVSEEQPKTIEPDPDTIIEDPPKRNDSDLKPKVFGNYYDYL
jgi:hypothetical protein